MRFEADTTLAPGAHLVVSKEAAGFPFGISCGDDVVRLADAGDTPVDSVALPVQDTAGATYGRIPDGAGPWAWTLPTAGAPNAIAPPAQNVDPAWLFDPLQVTEIDLEAGQPALSRLAAAPDEYVEARISLRNGTTTYGPYEVGVHLKGHTAFRGLDGKAAFKVNFAWAVAGQSFYGLKALTLNNMVQDPSMIAEAASALLLQATGAPASRVGYAYVRLNGADYGLYANVETIDAVMAKRWFTSTRHIYEANLGGEDAVPGRSGDFDVHEGSSTDRSDLEALSTAASGGAEGWWVRMQPVADLTEMTRVWAAEHYAGHWDGYSIGLESFAPGNYYLHSDLDGRFSLITSGTDQTWLERPGFGVYGKGVLMRACIADARCRELYVDALRGLAASPAVAALPLEVRAIRDAIAPWRALDPRREQTVAEGETDAAAKIASVDERPAQLAAWLASPSFGDGLPPAPPSGGGGGGPSDLSLTGTVDPASAPVGASHVWRLQVRNSGSGTATGVTLNVELSSNVVFGFGEVQRGSGCIADGSSLHCGLDVLKPAGDDLSTNDVVIGTNVTGFGEVTLAATATSDGSDPTPEDDTLVLKANVQPVALPQSTPAQPAMARPRLGKPAVAPAKPVAGRRFTFTLRVTRSDTGAPFVNGTLDCRPTLAGKILTHADSFKAGTIRLSMVVPKTAKGKLLRITIRLTASTSIQTAVHTYGFAVR
jgi:hypothetical protein